ncbi:MAG: hypothetical protein ACE5G2_00660 [Candidatus Krumholzibacteriia bacterium]
MSLVEFTPRAEKNLLDILGDSDRLEETLLVVDMCGGEAQLSFKNGRELDELQRDVEMVGPFRVPIGGRETTLFVRENEPAPSGVYELDYYARGGRRCFQIRTPAE